MIEVDPLGEVNRGGLVMKSRSICFLFILSLFCVPSWSGTLLGLRLAVDGDDLLNNLENPDAALEKRYPSQVFSLVDEFSRVKSQVQFEGLLKAQQMGAITELKFTEAFISCIYGPCGDVDLELFFSVDLPKGNYTVDSKIDGTLNGKDAADKTGLQVTNILLDGKEKSKKSKEELVGLPKADALAAVFKKKRPIFLNGSLLEKIVPIKPIPVLGNLPPVAAIGDEVLPKDKSKKVPPGNLPPVDLIDKKLLEKAKKNLGDLDSFNIKAFLTLFDMKEGDQLELPDSLSIQVTGAAPSVVPEPGTALLAGCALAAAAFWLRRRS
jgi:hypothetical protein